MPDIERQEYEDFGRSGTNEPTLRKSVRTQWRRAAGLALISGYVDAYTLLNFGVFASFMSGNTTSGGTQAGQAKLAAAGHSLLPIPFFVLGVFVGTLMGRSNQRRPLLRLSALVSLMLSVGTIAAYRAWPGWSSIMILSTAMGMLNTSITHVGGQTVSLGFVTGDLNGLAGHLAMGVTRQPVPQAQDAWDTRWRRATVLASVWSAFLVGAVLGSAMASRLAVWTLLLPSALLLVLALLERSTISDA
jgi:uncharacterized membrane protein YoaK (UPF0700 family)